MEGWHLNADEAACHSMADLMDRMLVAEWKPQKLIPVTVPRVMKNNRGVSWFPAPALRLRYAGDEAEADYWYIELQETELEIIAGRKRLLELNQSFLGLPKWDDDFAIRPQDRNLWDTMSLWFWTKID
jgi:hypothetical protein